MIFYKEKNTIINRNYQQKFMPLNINKSKLK